MLLSKFVKKKRNTSGLTQRELADKAGVGLRFVRDLEQGKETLRIDKVNQVMRLFGYELGPTMIVRSEMEEKAEAKESSDATVTKKKKGGTHEEREK
jgi:y4mF family transcriptional regulator